MPGYAFRVRASQYGIAVFESTLMEIPRGYKHSTIIFACPPDGLVPSGHMVTLDGATIIELPPEIPCDPTKRFVTGRIYVGQVR